MARGHDHATICGQVMDELKVQAGAVAQLYARADEREDRVIGALIAGVFAYLHDPVALASHTLDCALAWLEADARADREVARGCEEQGTLAEQGRVSHRALEEKRKAEVALTTSALVVG